MNRKFLILLLSAVTFSSVSLFAQSDDDDDRPVVRKHRRSSTSAVTSIYSLGLMHVTEDNVGFGASYEHFLDKKGIVSLYLPLSYSLPQDNDYYYGYRDNSGYYNYNDLQDVYTTNKGMLNFYPGIKIYPGGAHRKVTYAVGTSLVFGVGSADRRVIDYKMDTTYGGGGSYPIYTQSLKSDNTTNVSRFKMGMLVTNFLNLRPGDKYYFGIEFGLGYSYFSMLDGAEDYRQALVQLGIKIGLTK